MIARYALSILLAFLPLAASSSAQGPTPPATPPTAGNPFTFPDADEGGTGTAVVLHANHGSGDVRVTTDASGTDSSYILQAETLIAGKWVPVAGEPTQVSARNTGSVTIGPGQRLTGSDQDPNGCAGNNPVSGTASVTSA